jgi:predicted secreted protein
LLSIGESVFLSLMESDSEGRREAERSLQQIAADRARLAGRLKAPRWYGPLVGLLLAALLASTLVGLLLAALLASTLVGDGWWRYLPALLGLGVALALDAGYRKATGVVRKAPRGGRALRVEVLQVAAVIVLYCVAALFAGMHEPLLVVAVALVGLATGWGVVRLTDRALADDLRRAV